MDADQIDNSPLRVRIGLVWVLPLLLVAPTMVFIGAGWLVPRGPINTFSLVYFAVTLTVALVLSRVIGWQIGIRVVTPYQRHYTRFKTWMFSLTFALLALVIQGGLCIGALFAALMVRIFIHGERIM